MISTIFSIAITCLQALPGVEQSIAALVADIKGHPDLTQAQKDALVAQAKADVDAEDARVQAVDAPPVAP